MKIACYTDIHIQSTMLNYPTTLRKSAITAVDETLNEVGKVDLAIIGGDNFSDYPYWNRSCALPYKNFLDIKEKLVKNFERVAIDKKVLYVGGNNDPILGDIGTDENEPYNTCDFYHTGPMKETLGELSADDYYGYYSKIKGKGAGLYHLAFHYVINNIDFFGINLDPDDAFNNHECQYNMDSVKWLSKKLDEVDPDGTNTIFVVGHINMASRTTDGTIKDYNISPEIEEALISAFVKHKNLFYLYGHVHGQDYLHNDSKDAVIFYDEKGNITDSHKSFVSVHMGGLRPFCTSKKFEFFENDGLKDILPGESEPVYIEATGTPKIAQYLLVDVSESEAVFTMRNTGTYPGYTTNDKPKSFAVKFVK